jgi:hypothetical protein
VHPARGLAWITSDHPLLRLAYTSDNDYHFGGGWGRRGCDILLPVTPDVLLFAQVGHHHGRRFTMSKDQTVRIVRLLTERAAREIYATEPVEQIARVRPRKVDAEMYASEQRAWREWHQDQSAAEN